MRFFNSYTVFLLVVFFSSCEEDNVDVTPDAKNVTITGIRVITMPLTDHGTAWDPAGNADLYFTIQNQSTVLYSHPQYVENISSSQLPVPFEISGGYRLPLIDQSYSLDLYDYDDLSDNDFIGGFYFNPADYRSERPDKRTFSTTDLQIEISFKWE